MRTLENFFLYWLIKEVELGSVHAHSDTGAFLFLLFAQGLCYFGGFISYETGPFGAVCGLCTVFVRCLCSFGAIFDTVFVLL